jgi:hypothetical protein
MMMFNIIRTWELFAHGNYSSKLTKVKPHIASSIKMSYTCISTYKCNDTEFSLEIQVQVTKRSTSIAYSTHT